MVVLYSAKETSLSKNEAK